MHIQKAIATPEQNIYKMKKYILVIAIILLPIYTLAQNNLISDESGCSAQKPSFSFKATSTWNTQTSNGISAINTPLVGDIDGDGKPEVFAVNAGAANTVLIFEGATGNKIGEIAVGVSFGNQHWDPLALCKIDGKGSVFIAGNNGQIYLYQVSSAPGVRPITFTKKWEKTVSTGASTNYWKVSMPVATDLDGDGVVEFVAGDKIIDSRDGSVIATLPFFSSGNWGNISYVADVDDDGHPEVLVGSNIYKYDGSSVTLWKQCPSGTAREGMNMAADIDGDGKIDVAFIDRTGVLTVWTPSTGNIMGTVSGLGTTASYPFIGDVDNKTESNGRKYLEIVINTVNSLKAYYYTGTGFAIKWTLAHSDSSGATSLTLFDFNNNGSVEIVYRDQSVLRIFDGSVNGTLTDANLLTSAITCGSGTLQEAPIVADVTGTGSASIIVCGNPSSSNGNAGEVMVIGGGDSPWVSAPKVWNQQMYSPLLVNQDLSIPKTVKSPLLTFTDCNNKKVQMYNGGPMQAPLVSNTTYCIIDQAPDVYVMEEGSSIEVAGSSVTFKIKIGNKGSATASANTPICFYRDIISTNPIYKLGSVTLGVNLEVGQTTTVTKSFTVGATAINYYARIMDDGVSFPATGAFSDCDTDNNTLALVSKPPTGFTPTSTLFNDRIWYFGTNQAGTAASGKSPGIQFVGSGNSITPTDISGISRVYTVESTLTVSSPACDGSVAFYASHNHVYNAQHEPIKGGINPSGDPGLFHGDNSTSDNLAACYIGDNKYYMFAVSFSVNAPAGELYYYTIDMNGDNGKGELSTATLIDGVQVGEGVELIPVPDTSDEYWLIYYHMTRKEYVVYHVKPGSLTKKGTLSFTVSGYPYYLKRNGENNRLAQVASSNNIYLFHFNPFTGVMTADHTLVTGFASNRDAYGVEFSPGGKYLYATTWNGNQLLQYSLETFQKTMGTYHSTASIGGGGLRLGPDGKIYIPFWTNSKYVGVIKTPDQPLTSSTSFYDPKGLELNVTFAAYGLSEKLTPPAKDPLTTNQAPIAKPDVATGTNVTPTIIKPLTNDSDPLGHDLFLISANFVNPADAVKGSISVDAKNKTVTFIPNLGHTFSDGEQIVLTYRIRNNGAPVGLCSDATITITIKLAKLTITIKPSVDEGSSVIATVCMPENSAAPSAGIPVTLSRVGTSTAEAADFTMNPAGTATITVGNRCVDFTIAATADNLLEGEEKLILQATATNFIASDNAELIINDMDSGEIIVVREGNHASEPGTGGTFRIRFKNPNIKTSKRVKVVYGYSVLPTSGNNYTIPAGPVYIEKNGKHVDIPVAVNNNFIVEGAREITVEITHAEFD